MAGGAAVGVLRIDLHLPASGSLKAKRQVVSGLLSRARRSFAVAAAEVGAQDRRQLAELAFACLSDDTQHLDEVMATVLRFVEDQAGEAMVIRVSTQHLRF
jgi:uncharacterized protein YlxP (DUF503 family)